jgi:hypothetical protein
MQMLILTGIFFALLMSGCTPRNDLGPMIVQQVTEYGGHIRTTNSIPELRGTWIVEFTNSEGFQANMSGISVTDVQVFMQEVYGNSYDAHEKGIWYAAKDIGVSINFFSKTDGVEFICHRGHAYSGGPINVNQNMVTPMNYDQLIDSFGYDPIADAICLRLW